MLLLSATLGKELKQYLSSLFKISVKSFIISLQKAIDWDILPTPKIYTIPLLLSNSENTEVIIEEWGKSTLRKKYKCNYTDRWAYLKNKKERPNVTLEISCTPLQKYIYLSEKFEYLKKFYFRSKNIGVKK